jgi:hypothetical protein
MSRPKPQILLSKEVSPGTVWDVLISDCQYLILYKGQYCNLRKNTGWVSPGFKYLKSTYPNEGSARAQVTRLNSKFECQDFSYIKIT